MSPTAVQSDGDYSRMSWKYIANSWKSLIIIFTSFSICGCDTLSMYRDPSYFGQNKQLSFAERDSNQEFDIDGKVVIVNFQLKAWINVKNLSKETMTIDPSKFQLKSVIRNQFLNMEKVQYRVGDSHVVLEANRTLEILPGGIRTLVMNFNPKPLMPSLHIMKRPDLRKLELKIGGITRNRENLKSLSIFLEESK